MTPPSEAPSMAGGAMKMTQIKPSQAAVRARRMLSQMGIQGPSIQTLMGQGSLENGLRDGEEAGNEGAEKEERGAHEDGAALVVVDEGRDKADEAEEQEVEGGEADGGEGSARPEAGALEWLCLHAGGEFFGVEAFLVATLAARVEVEEDADSDEEDGTD